MAHIRLYYRAGAKLILLLASSVISTHHYDNYLAPAASDTPQDSELGSRPATARGSLYRRNTCIRRVASHRLRNPPNPIMSKFFNYPVITGIIVAIVGTAGAVAQLITPAPVPPTQYVQKRAFDSSWAAAHQKCWSTGAPANILIFSMPARLSGRAWITCGVFAQLDTTRRCTRLLSHPLGEGGSKSRVDAARAKYQSALLPPTCCLRRLAWTAKTASDRPLS